MISVALLIAIGAITPGPNNLFVMQAAGRGGLRRALGAIAAVVSGGLMVLALVMAGLGTVLGAWPQIRVVIALAGAGYLGWLGFGLLRARAERVDAPLAADVHSPSPTGLFAFQLFNPKGWVMALTVFAAAFATHRPTPPTLLLLASFYVLIPAVCLSLWSALGWGLANWIRHPRNRRIVDRTMGALLVGSALSLAIEVFFHQAIR